MHSAKPSSIQLTNPDYRERPSCAAGARLCRWPPNGSQAAGTPCNIIPQSLISPIGQKLINLYPLPNANNPALGYNYVSEPVRKLNEGKFDIRLDENISSKDTLFARFSYDQAQSYVPGGAPGFAEQGAFASNQGIVNHARNAAISETHIFSPTTVNQISVGFNRIFDYITSQGTGSCYVKRLGIPGANLGGKSCGLTSVEMSQLLLVAGRSRLHAVRGRDQCLDVLRFPRHGARQTRHSHRRLHSRQSVEHRGRRFPERILGGQRAAGPAMPAADLLTGSDSLAIHDQEFGGGNTGRRWKLYRPFVEDDWRVSKNLTLNLGLAWALMTPQTEVGNRMADFNPATGQFLIAGQNGVVPAPASRWIWTALEPRIGVAWKPFGKSNTVVRGGYAIFHDSSWNQGAQGLWQNPPYYADRMFAFDGMHVARAAQHGCATAHVSGFPLHRAPNPADFAGRSWRRTRTSSRAEFSSSTSMWSRSCPARSC